MTAAPALSDPDPVVSVVLPVRDGGVFLEPAIKSILGQSLKDLELLLIDDGSSDGSIAVMERFANIDRRVRVLKANGSGIVHALNCGVQAARGEYIARMDADDIAIPKRLEVQWSRMQQSPNLLALGSAAVIIDRQGVITGNKVVSVDRVSIEAEMLRRNPFIHSSMMIRTDALIAVGAYRNASAYAEDYDLWLRLSEIGEITNLADSLMQFRVHSAQVSQKMRLRQRAATALARQMAILRRAGLMESVDMSLPPMEALLAFLAVRGALEMPIEKGEAKDIEVMFRSSASHATPALVSVWTRRLRREAGIWSLPFKLWLQRRTSVV